MPVAVIDRIMVQTGEQCHRAAGRSIARYLPPPEQPPDVQGVLHVRLVTSHFVTCLLIRVV